MRRAILLTVPLAALAVTLLVPSTAGAAAPCRNRIYNDWYRDGRISSAYPLRCYRDALRHIPADARIYSNLSDDIRAALLAAIRREHGQKVPALVGKGFTATTRRRSRGTKRVHVAISGHGQPPSGPSMNSARVTSVSSSGGTPLPILVLGGVAIALAAAGAIGAGVRYARNRRGTA